MPNLSELQQRLEDFRETSQNLKIRPLLTESYLARFGIEYQPEILDRLEQSIEQDSKIFFTGHTGCGKSTLLAKLELNLNKIDPPRYFVVRFSIADTLEIFAVNHVNILFSIAIQMLDAVERCQEFILPSGMREELERWLTKHTKIEIKSRKSDGEIETEGKVKVGIPLLSELLVAIKSSLKLSSEVREEITTVFTSKIGDLIDRVDEITTAIEVATARQVLVIIDDLDKLPLELTETIFQNNIKSLVKPECKILYTLPIAVLRDVAIVTIIQQEVNRIETMPATKFFTKETVRKVDRVPIPEMVSMMEKALEQRLPDRLVSSDIKEQIVLKSGGLFREMFRIADGCCNLCISQLRKQIQGSLFAEPIVTIDASILETALNEIELDFSRLLGRKDYSMLKFIYDNFETEDAEDSRFQELLHGLYIVEYRNNLQWYDLNPIITDLLKRRGDIK
jgi:nucleoside-triphosphatase THEP1